MRLRCLGSPGPLGLSMRLGTDTRRIKSMPLNEMAVVFGLSVGECEAGQWSARCLDTQVHVDAGILMSGWIRILTSSKAFS